MPDIVVKPRVRNYTCQFCTKSYFSASNLSNHTRICPEKAKYIDTINQLQEELLHKNELIDEIRIKGIVATKAREDLICALQTENYNLQAIIDSAEIDY